MIITITIEDDKRPEITVADAREFPPVKGFVDADEQQKEETCKWRKDNDCLAANPHNSETCDQNWLLVESLKNYPFCPCCGKKIEVVE